MAKANVLAQAAPGRLSILDAITPPYVKILEVAPSPPIAGQQLTVRAAFKAPTGVSVQLKGSSLDTDDMSATEVNQGTPGMNPAMNVAILTLNLTVVGDLYLVGIEMVDSMTGKHLTGDTVGIRPQSPS
jgi:hypothetical protein